MYAGKIVESGSTAAVLEPPYHPYTEALLAVHSAAGSWPGGSENIRAKLDVMHARAETGCPFHTRCARKLGAVCENVDSARYRIRARPYDCLPYSPCRSRDGSIVAQGAAQGDGMTAALLFRSPLPVVP